jgi:NAD(P)-dependent dehydrogenase (short-subunit alcohol dehydrogenase family)
MPRLPPAVQARGCAARPRPSDGAVQRPRAGQAGRRLARRPRAWPTSSDRAKVLAAQLANEKGGPIALQADSGGAFQVKAAVDQTLTGFGRLDTLVVNASIPRLARIDHHNRQQCRCPCRLSSVYAMTKTAVAGW